MRNFSKKYLVSIIIFITVIAILFAVYISKYQSLVDYGSFLADEHCIKINPLIISRKNEYLNQIELMQASASAQEVQGSIIRYLESSDRYLNEEKKWLAKQKDFLNRWDFNLLMPGYIKEAASYQYKMYEADYLSSFYITQAFKEKDQIKQLELGNRVLEETAKSREAGDKYSETWEREKGKFDWVYHFVKIPESKCPVENLNIPNIRNPFLPQPSPSNINTPLS